MTYAAERKDTVAKGRSLWTPCYKFDLLAPGRDPADIPHPGSDSDFVPRDESLPDRFHSESHFRAREIPVSGRIRPVVLTVLQIDISTKNRPQWHTVPARFRLAFPRNVCNLREVRRSTRGTSPLDVNSGQNLAVAIVLDKISQLVKMRL